MAAAAMAFSSSFLRLPKISAPQQVPQSPPSARNLSGVARSSVEHANPIRMIQEEKLESPPSLSRRQAVLASTTGIVLAGMMELHPCAALADFIEDYKSDTEAVIAKVKETLALEKTDPAKPNAVASLRQSSNSWVAKYRREKSVAGKPSFSNMYSVLNAISGHYISFGPSSTIPAKRQQRILEEVKDAEKALSRGR
ncbi:photosystem II repair protein PSB27-H1, chloroplastic [Selaginella moellendorffii]|uniref:photosystem II repair protein PSB27-H1, chloroplastic n=1 Tax=Selaginella moellendorffii TaxID=88036 RepID=UPI000D1CE3EC|nr:photosystem II repair protein PSB27-H1, chloroplastic [Selaginella moellendorffii]|eukprot:XP_002961797.2 photosystem II repair protein PSB27-H1, chloroplastic [Selaginella moellendorffii]